MPTQPKANAISFRPTAENQERLVTFGKKYPSYKVPDLLNLAIALLYEKAQSGFVPVDLGRGLELIPANKLPESKPPKSEKQTTADGPAYRVSRSA